MSTLTLKNSTVGRAAKKAIEHLLATHRDDQFTYADFPPVDQEFLDHMAGEIKSLSNTPGVDVMNAENVEQWANSEIIGPLKSAGFVETVGYHTFAFTDQGKNVEQVVLQQ
jgi:hypothetical protein